jgi:hypothetical protein
MVLSRKVFVALNCAVLVALATACSHGGGSSSNGDLSSPDQLKKADYKDVKGQALGVWSQLFEVKDNSQGSGPHNMMVSIYFRNDAMAVRISCLRLGRVYADLVGKVSASMSTDAHQLTVNQDLSLKKDDCSFEVQPGTYAYSVTSDSMNETLTVSTGAQGGFSFQRQIPSESSSAN